jgi:hypothetical protein
MRALLTLFTLVAMLLLTACAEAAGPGGGDTADDDPADDPADQDVEGDSGPSQIIGKLGGDPELEGGCVWVETGDERYEVQWPEGWQADADSVQLRNPDGEVVASEGDELTVSGAMAHDVVTVCQVGPVFEATDVDTG